MFSFLVVLFFCDMVLLLIVEDIILSQGKRKIEKKLVLGCCVLKKFVTLQIVKKIFINT